MKKGKENKTENRKVKKILFLKILSMYPWLKNLLFFTSSLQNLSGIRRYSLSLFVCLSKGSQGQVQDSTLWLDIRRSEITVWEIIREEKKF